MQHCCICYIFASNKSTRLLGIQLQHPMTAKDLLQTHQLKRTSCREGLLNAFLASKEALSESDLRDQVAGSYDRTTFYRSFKTLLDAGVIHKIVVDNTLVKYALTTPLTRQHEHVHFFCTCCHTIQCLHSPMTFNLELPMGFHREDVEILIKGTCPTCC